MPSLQRQIYLPKTVEDARVLIGTEIEVYWEHSSDPQAHEDWPEDWYRCRVLAVNRTKVNGSVKTLLQVSYEDDEEELEWDEVFNGAPMVGRNGVRVHYKSQAAKDFVDGLATVRKRSQGSLTQSKVKRIKADPDASSSSQAMQDSTNLSATSQQLFTEHDLNGYTAGSNGSGQSANPGMHIDEVPTHLNGLSFDPEEIPPNKRQRTSNSVKVEGPKRKSGGSANALQARFNQLVQPGLGVGSSGQIAKIHLENFMCHDHLDVELNPHVNFICGSNGSGKSASLQAMQCCLGVKARDTGRATKIEAFIKTGCSHAVAAVTLWNTGHDAFMPTVYGSQITIERKITKASSTFIVKDAAKRKVGEGTRAQVDEILDHFNINAGNPAICMTQDMTRSFAGGQNDKDKYELYMAATHFAEIIENLVIAKHLVDQMRSILGQQAVAFEEKKAELRNIEQKLEDIQVVEQWQYMQELCSKVLPWEQIYELDREVKIMQQRCHGTLPDRYAKIAGKHSEAANDVNQIEKEYRAQTQALQDFQPQMVALQQQVKEQHAAYRAAVTSMHTAQQNAAGVRAKLGELALEKTSLQESVEKMQEDMKADSQAAVDQHAAAIRRHQEQTEAAAVAASDARRAVREVEAAVDLAVKQKTSAETAYKECNRRVQMTLGDLESLQQSQRRPVQAFAPQRCPPQVYDKFLGSVEQAVLSGQFHRPPLGPIGSFLTLTDPKWAVAVEMACGRAFGTYIAHDFADQKLLQSLANRVGLRGLSVYICSFDLPLQNIHAGRVSAVPAHLTTVMQVLSFPEENGHIIQNALIMQHSIERQVLVPDSHAGLRLIRPQSKAQGPAAAIINRCFAVSGDQVYSRKSTVTVIPVNHPPRPRLQRDVAAQIAQVQQELAAAQADADAAGLRQQTARQEEREARQYQQDATRQKQRKERDKTVADSQLEELLSQRPDDADTASAALQDTLAEIADKDAQSVALQRQLEDLEAAKTATEEAVQEAKAQVDAMKTQMETLRHDNEGCLDAIRIVNERREEAQALLAYYANKQQEVQEKLTAELAQLAQYKAEQERLEKLSAQVCPEKEEPAIRQQLIQLWCRNGMSNDTVLEQLQVDQLEQQLSKLNAKITQKEKEAGFDLQTLQVMQQRMKQLVSVLELKFSRIQTAHDLLKAGVEKREDSSQRMRIATEDQTNAYFNRYMFQRKFHGKIKISYQDQKLEVKVQLPGDAATRTVVKDMKTLSGGEKSYTTVCFITALAHGISSPFHCMDEFDVFMDPVIRRICLHLLLSFAIENSDRQLILLSPQDITTIDTARSKVQEDSKVPIPNPDHFFKMVQMQPARP